jgi:hypothetical protein
MMPARLKTSDLYTLPFSRSLPIKLLAITFSTLKDAKYGNQPKKDHVSFSNCLSFANQESQEMSFCSLF